MSWTGWAHFLRRMAILILNLSRWPSSGFTVRSLGRTGRFMSALRHMSCATATIWSLKRLDPRAGLRPSVAVTVEARRKNRPPEYRGARNGEEKRRDHRLFKGVGAKGR